MPGANDRREPAAPSVPVSGPSVIDKHRAVQKGVWTPPGTGMRAVWAVCSDAGCSIDGSRKTNQDSYLVDLPRPDTPELLVGVFDGHGEHGHHVSRQCKAQFSELLHNAERSHPDLHSATTAAYVEQDHACTLTLDCSQSGTTAVTCHLQADELSGRVNLTTAWVGDSRAVLVQVRPDGSVIARDLSVDQSPERPDEKARPANPRPEPANPRAQFATPRPQPATLGAQPATPRLSRHASNGAAACASRSSTRGACRAARRACGTSPRWRRAWPCRARSATPSARWWG